ncbi:MAG: glucosamine-6-phosphate deaminase [Balneolaceae bacterium]
MGQKAAEKGAEEIRRALAQKGQASIVVATGASQFEMLGHLVRSEKIDWSKVTAFHLDEYIGIPFTHNASFRKYLKERFVEKLPCEIGRFHYIQAENNPKEECQRLGRLISHVDIDVAFIGIGENGHIAFNDPPADFKTVEPYIVVQLDEACRRQQMGEGWFPRLSDVPEKAISMSVRQIMKSNTIVCTVPDSRKADAVRKALKEPVTPQVPATKLQEHPDCHLFLDQESARMLRNYV